MGKRQRGPAANENSGGGHTIIINAKVSLDRLDEFLHTVCELTLHWQCPFSHSVLQSELIDVHADAGKDNIVITIENAGVDPEAIGFCNASFTWTTSNRASTPGRRNFTLRIDGDLFFQRNKINLVVGPTGSGKTSLLMALLGEMHSQCAGPESWFNLPRVEGVAYCAQEPWVQNETIKVDLFLDLFLDDHTKTSIT